MNTLLGEIATLNDILYPVYRVAFKFRKLQKAFLLDNIEVSTLQEALHQSSIQGLERGHAVPLSQLRSFITELYTSIKVLKPSLGASKLQQARELFFNWCQMVYLTSTSGSIQSGSFKILLCLLLGAKPFDKARIIFGELANHSGTVEASGIAYFCEVTQQIGDGLQENLYDKWSPEQIFHDCLAAVRSAEDIEDEEELDGGFKKPWLSQFEFTKLLTASPGPKFLAWLILYHKLPSVENEVHSVRCCDCTRKPIVSLRYQCTQCPNYNLCQMCFLKGRTTDKHLASHQVLEFSSGGKGQKGWKQRLLGHHRRPEGHLFEGTKEPFVYSPRTSRASPPAGKELVDSAVNSITDMMISTQQNSTQGLETTPRTHQPTMIRIKSDESPLRPTHSKPPSQLVNGRSAGKPPKGSKDSSSKRTSFSSSGGSPDSTSSGGKFNFDSSSDVAWRHSSLSNASSSTGSDVHSSPAHEDVRARIRRSSRNSSADSAELGEINRRLSMEVDQLLSELPPPSSQPKLKLNTTSMSKLQLEERALKGQINSLSGKRTKLSGELSGVLSQLQQMQTEGSNSALNYGAYLLPSHSRCDSAPMDPYVRVGSASPPSLRSHALDAHKSMNRLSGSHQLLDPLVDFTPEQLNTYKKDLVSPEDYRMST